jgi:ribosome biogenesis GTPase / thiamine phosphate phosphatase
MVLPRQTKFSRNSFDRKRLNSKAQEQIIAANIDKTFIVNALNQDFNLSRMERYLIIVWDSGSVPYLICVMKLRKNLGRLIKLAWVLKFG